MVYYSIFIYHRPKRAQPNSEWNCTKFSFFITGSETTWTIICFHKMGVPSSWIQKFFTPSSNSEKWGKMAVLFFCSVFWHRWGWVQFEDEGVPFWSKIGNFGKFCPILIVKKFWLPWIEPTNSNVCFRFDLRSEHARDGVCEPGRSEVHGGPSAHPLPTHTRRPGPLLFPFLISLAVKSKKFAWFWIALCVIFIFGKCVVAIGVAGEAPLMQKKQNPCSEKRFAVPERGAGEENVWRA